jgi:hypothetical protein
MIRNAEQDFQTQGGLPDGQFFADPFVSSGNPDVAAHESNKINAG